VAAAHGTLRLVVVVVLAVAEVLIAAVLAALVVRLLLGKVMQVVQV
jgi:hypothetical protein